MQSVASRYTERAIRGHTGLCTGSVRTSSGVKRVTAKERDRVSNRVLLQGCVCSVSVYCALSSGRGLMRSVGCGAHWGTSELAERQYKYGSPVTASSLCVVCMGWGRCVSVWEVSGHLHAPTTLPRKDHGANYKSRSGHFGEEKKKPSFFKISKLNRTVSGHQNNAHKPYILCQLRCVCVL